MIIIAYYDYAKSLKLIILLFVWHFKNIIIYFLTVLLTYLYFAVDFNILLHPKQWSK